MLKQLQISRIDSQSELYYPVPSKLLVDYPRPPKQYQVPVNHIRQI